MQIEYPNKLIELYSSKIPTIQLVPFLENDSEM